MDAMSQAVMELLDRQLGLARADTVLARQPGQAEHAATIKARKGEAAKRGSGAYNPVSEVAIANAPNSDVARFLASLPISNQSNRTPRRNVPSGSMGGVSQRVAGLGAPFPMAAMPTAARGGSTSFEAGPSSQDGLDMASALLQQRLGAMGQNQNMDLMYRRDPRAATALIQAQIAAQEEAANRAQRGDIASQEMNYRNRSLDMQGQMAGADRQASMDRLLASLAARRGETADQMSHAKALQEAAQIAATQEAARQREHQTGLADKQITAQTSEGKLSREQQVKLEMARMMNDLAMKQAELSGADNRTKAELLNTFVQGQIKAASELPAEDWAQVQGRYAPLMQQFGVGPQGAATAATTAPEPKTTAGRFAAKNAELKSIWDKSSEGKDAMIDFLLTVPPEDIRANRDAMKDYLKIRYPGMDPNDEVWGGMFWSKDSWKKAHRARAALGLPMYTLTGKQDYPEDYQ